METRLLREVIATPMDEDELAYLNEHNTGLAATVGIVVTHCAHDLVEGYLDADERHLQIAGIVNGGTFCAIGETLGSLAAIAAAAKPAVGMSNSTDLIASVRAGERIWARATPIHVGSRTHLWRVEMRTGGQDGKLAALTHLKLMIL